MKLAYFGIPHIGGTYTVSVMLFARLPPSNAWPRIVHYWHECHWRLDRTRFTVLICPVWRRPIPML
jgi:hypothetical protein